MLAQHAHFGVADVECTIIETEMLDEMASLRGIEERVGEITGRAMNAEIFGIMILQSFGPMA